MDNREGFEKEMDVFTNIQGPKSRLPPQDLTSCTCLAFLFAMRQNCWHRGHSPLRWAQRVGQLHPSLTHL